jgi:hypothetical protein
MEMSIGNDKRATRNRKVVEKGHSKHQRCYVGHEFFLVNNSGHQDIEG